MSLSGLFVGKRPEQRLFTPPSMERHPSRINGKPSGGLWTSPETGPGRSAWLDWCRDEMPHRPRYQRMWRLTATSPRIYTINTFADLKHAIQRWPHQCYPDVPPWSSLADEWEIDYVAMADEYDAVELTDDGQWATRLSFPENLYGWDVASILWLRWMFDSVTLVKRRQRAA